VVNAPKAIILEDREIAIPLLIASRHRARSAVSQCQRTAKAGFAARRVRGHSVVHLDARQYVAGVLTAVFDVFLLTIVYGELYYLFAT
jgi:hypothetical protein